MPSPQPLSRGRERGFQENAGSPPTGGSPLPNRPGLALKRQFAARCFTGSGIAELWCSTIFQSPSTFSYT